MNGDLVLTNAQVVTRHECFAGSVAVRDGVIAAVDRGSSSLPGALDFGGDYLIPGLVELHTDNLERHFAPRPGVRWPRQSAIFAHDAQLAGSAITTALDAIALGDATETSPRVTMLADMFEAVRHASRSGMTRAEHFLHLRCELTYERVVEVFAEQSQDPLVRLVSIMDHTPGQRQFVDLDKYRAYYQGKYHLSDAEIGRFMARQQAAHERFAASHRDAILRVCRARGLALASHDDATIEHVVEAVEAGMVIAEFPTTFAAAEMARDRGLSILMGAPNLVLGSSHSGNISAGELARRGLLDIVSSDYVPASLLHGAFVLTKDELGLQLSESIAKVSAVPAQLVGLADRGAIAAGLRADLAWVKDTDAGPIVRTVWREGRRVG